MTNLSRNSGRMMSWMCWVLLWGVFLPFPRPIVHSHAEVERTGVCKDVLERHLFACHSQNQTEVPFCQLHFHWPVVPAPLEALNHLLNEVVFTPQGSSVQLIVDFGGSYLFACYPEVERREVEGRAELARFRASHYCLNSPTISGPCQRIRFCVWTC